MPLRRIALVSLVLAAWGGSAAAQEGTAAMNRRAMNLIALQGPPEPAAFGKAVGLDARQTTQYGQLRRAYLQATKVERDSLGALRDRMRAMRSAGQAAPEGAPGERTARREPRGAGMQAMRPLVDSLEARFADFEADLAFLLRPDQQKKYEAWKEAEAARIRSEMTERRR